MKSDQENRFDNPIMILRNEKYIITGVQAIDVSASGYGFRAWYDVYSGDTFKLHTFFIKFRDTNELIFTFPPIIIALSYEKDLEIRPSDGVERPIIFKFIGTRSMI